MRYRGLTVVCGAGTCFPLRLGTWVTVPGHGPVVAVTMAPVVARVPRFEARPRFDFVRPRLGQGRRPEVIPGALTRSAGRQSEAPAGWNQQRREDGSVADRSQAPRAEVIWVRVTRPVHALRSVGCLTEAA